MDKIGGNIATLRKRAGWTQSELAGLVGTTSTYLSALERGVAHPSSELVTKFAEAFCVSEMVVRYGENCCERMATKSHDRRQVDEMLDQLEAEDSSAILRVRLFLNELKEKK